jgi:hypothetical protein
MSIASVLVAFMILAFLQYALATHISKPVVTTDKQTFVVNENVTVTGWVEYQNSPASEVLLDIIINKLDDGNQLAKTQARSNESGNFTSTVNIPVDTIAGNYALNVISQCKDEHRNICTNQNSSIPITVSD